MTKIPRFAFEKFPAADSRLTTQMKSVGEVMAMGRTFQESFQKALRGLETGIDGLTERSTDREEIVQEIGEAGPERILYVADAFRIGMTPARRSSRRPRSTRGSWPRSSSSCRPSRRWPGARWPSLSADELRFLKQKGFSDRRLAKLLGTNQHDGAQAPPRAGRAPGLQARRHLRGRVRDADRLHVLDLRDETASARPSRPDRKKIMVLGGGPNRIGQGIEFDYCCVHAALAMREDGYETIMVNCNPETVSTDYDTSDRLYFEPVTLEDVLEIVDKEKPVGVIVQYGGQTPLKLALDLERAGVPIIGTSPDSIDIAEDRERFQKLLHELGLKQPPNRTARTEEAGAGSWRRRSATRWWCARATCSAAARWRSCTATRTSSATCARPCKVSEKSPVLLDRFLDDAIEVDVDCIATAASAA